MEGTAEIGEERFGGAIRGQSLYGNRGRDGAHVEDIPFMARYHILPEVIAEHSRRVHVQIENQRVEAFGIEEKITVVIDARVINEHLHFELIIYAILMQFLSCRRQRKVALKAHYLNGILVSQYSCFFVDCGLIAHNQKLIASGG